MVDSYSRTKGSPTGEFIKSHPFILGDQIVSKEVKVQHMFRFIDEVEEQTLSLTSPINKYGSWGGWGRSRFIEREALERSKHLKDDSFVIRCDITIINDFRIEEMVETATSNFVTVPPSDLHQHLGDLLQTEKGADVIFEVGRETFKAHRSVIGARSPVFSAELFGTMTESCSASAIRIDDMEPHVFKALLCFMYTDSLPEMDKEEETAMSQHLLVAADRYNLERLQLICENKLCKLIEADSLATVLALAEQHHCNGLKKACFNFLSSPVNLKAVLASYGFEHLNRSCPSVIKELIAKLGT